MFLLGISIKKLKTGVLAFVTRYDHLRKKGKFGTKGGLGGKSNLGENVDH